MSVRAFFQATEEHAAILMAVTAPRPAIEILDASISWAMVEWTPDALPRMRLQNGEGGVARARLLRAARIFGLDVERRGQRESLEAWIGRCLRANLLHIHVVPLLRAARERSSTLTAEELES